MAKIVRNVITCANCREPITDGFIIGEPALISQGKNGANDKYDVYYHKNRPECRNASGDNIAYMPSCNVCKNPAYQSFARKELPELLKAKAVKFYCMRCDNAWPATSAEEADLARLLEDID